MAVIALLQVFPHLTAEINQLNHNLSAAGATVQVINTVEADIVRINSQLAPWVASLRAGRATVDPAEQDQFHIELAALENSLVSLESHARRLGIAATNHPVFVLLNTIREMMAAAGLTSARLNQESKVLQRLDKIILAEAEDVEAELKEKMSKEAQELLLEQEAWGRLQNIIFKLQQIAQHLKLAHESADANVAKSNYKNADDLIVLTDTLLINIENEIKKAVTFDEEEVAIAKAAAKKLKDIYSKLKTEAARIKREQAW